MRKNNEFFGIKCWLFVLLAVTAGYDLWEILSGNVDFSQHILGFFPAIVCAFIAIVMYTERHSKT